MLLERKVRLTKSMDLEKDRPPADVSVWRPSFLGIDIGLTNCYVGTVNPSELDWFASEKN
jgi:hypothetical protein